MTEPSLAHRARRGFSILAKPLLTENPHIYETYAQMRHLGAHTSALSPKELLLGGHDVLHIHWPDRIFYGRFTILKLCGLWGLLTMARLRRMEVVYTCHNFLPKNKVSKRLLRCYFGILQRNVTGLIVPRSDMARHLRMLFPQARIAHIPLGLAAVKHASTDTSDDLLVDVLHADVPEEFVFIPGVQEATKRTEEAIDFIRLVCPQKTVLVVGRFPDPAYKSMLEERFQSDQQVILIDIHLEEATFNALCLRADAVIASQKGGTNSGIALVSLALGVPCFCATTSIANLVQRDYDTTLVRPLSQIGDADVWTAIQAAPVNVAQADFSIQTMAQRMLDFMIDLSKSRR